MTLVSAQAGERLRVELDAGLLTLQAERAPLSEVIAAVGERAGFETVIVGDLSAPVSVSFARLPLDKALDRLLRGRDRILVYAPGDEGGEQRAIVKLWVFESGEGTSDASAETAAQTTITDDLNHADAGRRSLAVFGLARAGAGDGEVGAIVSALLEDVDPLVRSRAAIALGKVADPVTVPILEQALADEHASVRIQAIHALGQIESEQATRILGELLLHGGNGSDRVVAVFGLAKHDTPLARQYLDAAANDPDEQVRAAAAVGPGRNAPRVIEIPAQMDRWGPGNVR